MKTTLAVIFTLLILPSISVRAQNTPQGISNSQKTTQVRCTSTPCANTATGEDPSEIAERVGAKIMTERLGTASDRERWRMAILYSDSKVAGGPKIDVIKADAFSINLQPKTGLLHMVSKEATHTFVIAAPVNTAKSLCPNYAISVVDATSDIAVLKKSCFLFEHAPKRYYRDEQFYIYDRITATMRNIWDAALEDNTFEGPLVTPTPVVKPFKNGFQLDWTVTDMSKSATEKFKVRMRYTREIKKGEKLASLVCTDLSAPKGEGVEQGACEGDRPKLVAK
jgi:hypothetical protein